jgi:hypothetical protein
VVKIASAGEALHAKWVEVTDADLVNGRPLIRRSCRMLRCNAEQLRMNLLEQGWEWVQQHW